MGAKGLEEIQKPTNGSVSTGNGHVPDFQANEGVGMRLLICVCAMMIGSEANSAVVRIGNGDEGSDLEGFQEVTKGILTESRADAVKLLKSLNVNGVKGLGMLLPEVESSKLYLTKKDSLELDQVDQGSYHVDMKGRVYARTFAEPHAPTRFFPVSQHLDREQLVALHIHEGLHRSLAPEIRENESIVSEITLAITSPDSSFDRVQKVVAAYVPQENAPVAAAPKEIPETAKIKKPSEFSYGFRKYAAPKSGTTFEVNSMHLLETVLYPFGSENFIGGVGFELSLVNRPEKSFMGPLRVNLETKMWSVREFDIGFWGSVSLNTLSAEELKASQFGRDAYRLGLSIRKDLDFFSIENIIGYTFSSQTKQTIGAIEYTYDYGGVVEVSTHPAFRISNFRVGGFLELLLGDYYRVSGGSFSYDPGRYRILSAGPEIEYKINSVAFGLSGRFLLNATEDASYDSLGDLLGTGVSQGNITAKVSYYF